MVVMENKGYQTWFLFLVLFFSVLYTEQLQSSQVQTFLRIKLLLNSPPSLSTWNENMDLCSIEPTSAFTIICYEGSITQLHIIGDNGVPPLPENFSIQSFVTTLVKLPSLKVLTLVSLGLWGNLPGKLTRLSSLEILNLTSNFLQGGIPPSLSSLDHLQTLILDCNNFTGTIPDGIGSLSGLAVLSVKNNSLTGSLPQSLGNLENLRILRLSNNNFTGDVPDLRRLANLQVLDLENNFLGPYFPIVGDKIERIVLRKNKFTFGIPSNVSSYYQMKSLDISSNRFVGPFPVYLMSLPSLSYLDISENKFTGFLSENLTCNDELEFVSITSNLLTGKLPTCLVSHPGKRVVLYADNCLETGDEHQQPVSFCENEALAVGILPRRPRKRASKAIVTLSICGGTLVVIILAAATYFAVKKILAKIAADGSLSRFASESTYTVYTSKFLKDARYVTQAKKLGALSLPAYRSFSLEELKEATANFNSSAFLGDGSHGQMYQGQLRDGFSVAIRRLELKRNCVSQHFRPHIETISKLRHQHLVSALGHCFEYNLDDSSLSRLYLVFEHVPNGTLRSWISEKIEGRNFTWSQRIAAVTGVAKGIQFLHTGIVPGLFGNNIKITDALVDQNLLVKVSTHNLPWISDNMGKDRTQNLTGKDLTIARKEHQKDKWDIYDIGVILFEVISGKTINTKNEVDVLLHQLKASIATDDASSKSFIVDPMVHNTCSNESVKTMIEICWRCLHDDPAERPSIEDVLWNLQFAAQVQDAWRGDSQSSECSPISPLPFSNVDPTTQL